MTKKINDLDKKIKDAADKEYPCEGKFVPCNSYVICYNCEHNSTFLEGANFMRELMQGEIDRLQKCCDLYDVRTAERNNAREQLAVAVEALENYFYNFTHSDDCNDCNNTEILNSDMYAALSKIKGGAE